MPNDSRTRVLHDVPFHSPSATPRIAEKNTALDISTANEMYRKLPIIGSPAFWNTNCITPMTPTRAERKKFERRVE